MKRILTPLLMLVAMIASTQVWADNYNVWVGNVRVTDTNKSDINPTGKTAGKIWYETNGVLHFENVTMSATEGYACISSSLSGGLTVVFKGTNRLTSTGAANTVYSTTELTLKGPSWDDPGTLTLNSNPDASTGYAAIYNNTTEDLNIYSLYLTAKSTGKYGIIGNSGSLFTSTSEVSATGGSKAVSSFTKWHMLDYGILLGGYTYNTSSRTVLKSDGSVASTCTLKNGMYVGRTMPRLNGNLSSLSPEGLTSGTISWNETDKKLTLNGVTYSSSNWPFVVNYNIDGLNIETTSNSTITCNGVDAFVPRANTTFTGLTSSCKLVAKGYNAISVYGNTTVTLNMNAAVYFEGEYCGYYGDHDASLHPNSDLIIKKAGGYSDYYFKGGYADIRLCSHLELDGMDFFYSDTYGTPGCYFNETTRDVRKTGGEVVAGTWVNFYRISTYYPIYVAGKQLNSCNALNEGAFGSQYISSGTVTYNATTRTLTLKGVTMNTSANDDINGITAKSSLTDLTINFAGDSDQKQYLTASNDVLDLACNTTITGTSKVYLNSTKESGISTRNNISVTMYTSNFLETKGARYAYWGSGNSNEKLTLRKETSDIFGYRFDGAEGIIHNVTELVLDNMDFWQGYSGYVDGCYFQDKDLKVNGGEIAKGRIAFGSIQEKLPIYICGKQLNKTSDNLNYTIYVGSPYIESGSCSVGYNPFNNTLTLNNATIDYFVDDDNAFVQTDANTSITIKLEGDNTVGGNFAGLWLRSGNHAIEGDGTLKLDGSDCAIYLSYGTSLDIRDNVTVEAYGNTYGGIWSNVKQDYPSLFVTGNSTVKASTISGIGSMIFANAHGFVEPAGAVFDSNAHEVQVNGSTAHNIVIAKGEVYPIRICGISVNEFNCNDIKGKFSYNNAKKMLTINGNYVYAGSGYVVESSIEGLTINIASNSTITSQSTNPIIRMNGSTTIRGGALTLMCTNPQKDGTGIYCTDGCLTFDTAHIEVVGDGFAYGIAGEADVDLVIAYSDIIATAHECGAIRDFKSITLEGSNLVEPEGAQILSYGIANANGSIVGCGEESGTVVIQLDPDGIKDVENRDNTNDGIYDLIGRKLDKIGRGINILRDKDGNTRKILRK